MKQCGDIPVYLFANKTDLVGEDELDEIRIRKMVEENNLQGYYLTSAITGNNIIKTFDDITEELYVKAKTVPPQKIFPKEKVKKRKRKN